MTVTYVQVATLRAAIERVVNDATADGVPLCEAIGVVLGWGAGAALARGVPLSELQGAVEEASEKIGARR
jgi:hypothetical protein